MPTSRSLSFAIVDARSFRHDRAALASALAAAAPHVAVVHNAPHLGRWRAHASAIARNAGLVVVGGGRRAGANLVLSSLAIDFVATSDVPFRRHPLRPAGAVVARLRRGGVEFAAAAVTLGAATVLGDTAVLRAALSDVAGLPYVLSVLGDPAAVSDLGTLVGSQVVVSPSLTAGEVRTGTVTVVEVACPEA